MADLRSEPGLSGLAIGTCIAMSSYHKIHALNRKRGDRWHGKFPETAGAGGKRQNEESILVNPSDNECRSAEFLPHSILQWQTGNDLNIQNKKTIKSVMTHLCGGILFSHESHVLKKYGKMFKIDHQVEKTDYEIGYIL